MSNNQVKPADGDAEEPKPAKKPTTARRATSAAKAPAGEAATVADKKSAAARKTTAPKKVAAGTDDAPASVAEKPATARRSTAAPKKAPAAKAAPAKATPATAEAPATEAPAAEAPATEPPAADAPAASAKAPAVEPPAPAPAASAATPASETQTEAPATSPAILPDLPAAKTGDQRREYKGTGRRVVVAEDEALIRLDVVETLREAGFDVVGEAGDGEKAVALATELRPDVVVMDIKMPILDGISAAERIGKARIAPVVLLTAFSQAELVERARDAGAMAYVVKPFTPAELLPAIEIAVARHQEITALEAEVADLAERFETRKRVERAKGLLQSKMGLTEPESFRWIQKTSMDRRLTMREVADAVIEQVGSGDKAR